MNDVFGNLTLALGSYRHTVGSIIPGMTRVAWSLKKDELQKEIPGITRKKFLYNLSRSSYEKEWGTEYHKPGCGTKLLTFLFRIIPTSGPFKALKIRTPTPEVEKLFMASFNATVDHYRALLANVDTGQPELPNENLDVGGPDSAGKYKGTDKAYAKLLGQLADHQFIGMPQELRGNILAYYKDLKPPVSAKVYQEGKKPNRRSCSISLILKAVPESQP